MAAEGTLGDSFTLAIDGVDAPLQVVSFSGSERLHAPFRVEVEARVRREDGESEPVDLDAALGAKASLELVGEAPRTIVGLVDEVSTDGELYRFTLVPRLALLADAYDFRVHLEKDALAITKERLEEAGLDLDVRASAPVSRAQCVQTHGESNLAYAMRLLAESGIVAFVDTKDGADTVVLCDEPAAHDPIEGEARLPWTTEGGALVGAEGVHSARLREKVAPTKVTLRDFDMLHPKLDLTAEAGEGTLEIFEHEAGFVDPSAGKALAQRRLEERSRETKVLEGSSSCRRLQAGRTFELSESPQASMDGKWLVVSVEHEARAISGGTTYDARFVAVPADKPWRPPRAKSAAIGGLQTATITGPSGSEIHPDEHGRVKTKLRWDRLGKDDDTASTWVRPVQPALSGSFFLPRTGWEVVLGFARGSADEPIELGRLDNGVHPTAEGLPAQKVRSAFGSGTTPGGGSKNMMRMDDAAGNEGFGVVASADLNERTENDKKTTVAASDTNSVGGPHDHIVGIVQKTTVIGAESLSVAGSRSVTTVGQIAVSAASESISIGGSRTMKVGGDLETSCSSCARGVGGAKIELAIEEQNRHVTGVSTIAVGGGWVESSGVSSSISVLGANTLTAAGPLAIKASKAQIGVSAALKELYASRKETAGGKRIFGAKGAIDLKVGGSCSMKGATVVFKAKGKISIKAGGATITITPGSIKVKGAFKSGGKSVVSSSEKVT